MFITHQLTLPVARGRIVASMSVLKRGWYTDGETVNSTEKQFELDLRHKSFRCKAKIGDTSVQ